MSWIRKKFKDERLKIKEKRKERRREAEDRKPEKK
jgi:hypothetical protein